MTINEFMTEFAKVAGNTQWITEKEKYPSFQLIRTIDGYCPICFLAKELGYDLGETKVNYNKVYGVLGLDESDARTIAVSSDNTGCPLRQQLVKITGVSE